ncbi:MAG: hypothetical protein NT009_11710 [Proteobacteria bacterium]|jgi:hypothetical protein|nr:hypothetical protein [Pseudomonadota bacterium]
MKISKFMFKVGSDLVEFDFLLRAQAGEKGPGVFRRVIQMNKVGWERKIFGTGIEINLDRERF